MNMEMRNSKVMMRVGELSPKIHRKIVSFVSFRVLGEQKTTTRPQKIRRYKRRTLCAFT